MTPYEIDVLLWYYTRAEDHPHCVSNPPVWRPTIDSLLGECLIDRVTDGHPAYRLLERGRVYCEALRTVPLPEPVVPRWVVRWPK